MLDQQQIEMSSFSNTPSFFDDRLLPIKHEPSVFVIEAHGKVKKLKSILNKIGYAQSHVCATGGHFYQFPVNFDIIGVDEQYNETHRLIDQEIQSKLMESCYQSNVIIATDNDDEGHAIALDIFKTVKDCALSFKRMYFNELSIDAIRQSLDTATPYSKQDQALAQPAIARRVVDRIIGCYYSRRKGIPSGRVFHGLLGAIKKDGDNNQIPIGEYIFQIHSETGQLFSSKPIKVYTLKQKKSFDEIQSQFDDLKIDPNTISQINYNADGDKSSGLNFDDVMLIACQSLL